MSSTVAPVKRPAGQKKTPGQLMSVPLALGLGFNIAKQPGSPDSISFCLAAFMHKIIQSSTKFKSYSYYCTKLHNGPAATWPHCCAQQLSPARANQSTFKNGSCCQLSVVIYSFYLHIISLSIYIYVWNCLYVCRLSSSRLHHHAWTWRINWCQWKFHHHDDPGLLPASDKSEQQCMHNNVP